MKAVRAEIGTTGRFEEVTITENVSQDIGTAVELEHPCEDSHCDIGAALRAGCPLSAAYLLSGATETPLLDAVARAHSLDLSEPADWTDWTEFHSEHGRECDACGSFTYQDEGEEEVCGNCLAPFKPIPDWEGDAFISPCNFPAMGYALTIEGKHIGNVLFDEKRDDTFHRASVRMQFELRRRGYFPDVWEVNERGNTELLVWDPEKREFKHAGIGYV